MVDKAVQNQIILFFMNLSCTVPSCLGFGWEMLLTLRRTRKHATSNPHRDTRGEWGEGRLEPPLAFSLGYAARVLFQIDGLLCRLQEAFYSYWIHMQVALLGADFLRFFTLPKLSKEQ